MLCDRGRKLYEQYEAAHRELEIAKQELQSASAKRTQSGHRLGKVEEVERGAAAIFKHHQEDCATCRAEEVSSA
jgi:DNA anti-recombination protein RmuC